MISQDEFLALAQVYPVLLELTHELKARILVEARRTVLPAKTVLFDLESECHFFVLVLRGAVRVSQPTHLREMLLYRVLPGESCVMTVSCLLGKTNYQARGVVEQDLVAYTLPADTFSRLVLESEHFRVELFRFFGGRILNLMEMIQQVAFERLDQRLARVLLARCQAAAGDQFRCTHQQLAEDLGTAREVISRCLREWDAQGIVRLYRGQICVLDERALVTMAGG